MNTHVLMQAHARNYLDERRRLGFGLCSPGYSVMSFARFIDALNNQGSLTVEVMADWARQSQGNSGKPLTWARRLKHLRPFCRYLTTIRNRLPKCRATISLVGSASVWHHISILNRRPSICWLPPITWLHLFQDYVAPLTKRCSA